MQMRQILKDMATSLARRMGYSVIPNWRIETFHAANFVRRLFDFLEIDGVIDVGANTGQFRDFLRKEVRYPGDIVSFEPIPDLVTRLREIARDDPKWVVKGCALGASAGRAEFNVMASTVFSSFLNPTHDVVEQFRTQNDVREKMLVDVRTLDDVIPEFRKERGTNNIFLKLDTQGFDLEVLRGGVKTLGSLRALQFEASVQRIYEGMPRYDEVIRYLEDRGFAISGIFPVDARQFPVLVEFDCYMINKAFVPGALGG